jgi:hypothetical protein
MVSSPIVPVSVSLPSVPVIVCAGRRGSVGRIARAEIRVGEGAGAGVLEDERASPSSIRRRCRPGPIGAGCRRRFAAAEGSPSRTDWSCRPSRKQAQQRPVIALEQERVAAGAGREVGDGDRRRPDIGMVELDRVAAAAGGDGAREVSIVDAGSYRRRRRRRSSGPRRKHRRVIWSSPRPPDKHVGAEPAGQRVAAVAAGRACRRRRRRPERHRRRRPTAGRCRPRRTRCRCRRWPSNGRRRRRLQYVASLPPDEVVARRRSRNRSRRRRSARCRCRRRGCHCRRGPRSGRCRRRRR